MIDRRGLLAAGIAVATLAPLRGAWAAEMVETLKVFVPANPGGGWDQTARVIEAVAKAEGLIKGAQVTNLGGAGGVKGLPTFVNQWKGQGDSMMVGGMVMVGAIVTNKSPVTLKQVTPLARLTGEYNVIVVPASSPMKTIGDLVAAMKKDIGAVSVAGGSAGGTDHILMGLIAKSIGADAKKVAYVPFSGGGPAQAALLGSQVVAGTSGWGEFEEQIKAGKLRALAVSSPQRLPGIDVPTLKESGVDVELANWRGIFAPPGISDADRKKMLSFVDALVKSKGWKAELEKRGWSDEYLAGDAFAKFLEQDIQRIEAVLKDIGLA
jgi:putative tricarboxylic transport membrane protein